MSDTDLSSGPGDLYEPVEGQEFTSSDNDTNYNRIPVKNKPKVSNQNEWKRNKRKRCLAQGKPYIPVNGKEKPR